MTNSNLKRVYWLDFLKSIPRRQLASTIFYGILRILISTLWPYIMYRYIQTGNKNSPFDILIGILLVVVLFLISGFASHRQSLINVNIMETFSLNLVQRMWNKINSLEWLGFYSKTRVYFFDLFMVDAWRLRLGMIALLELIIINGIITGVLILFIAFISLPLFFLCLAGILIIAFFQFYSNLRIRPFVQDFHQAWRNQHHWISKVIDQFSFLKMDRGYQESENANTENTGKFLASNAALLVAHSKWRTINQSLGNAVRLLIFAMGFYWVQIHFIHLPELMLVLLIISVIQNNMSQLPGAVNSLIEALESQKSIDLFFLLEEEYKIEILHPQQASELKNIAIKGLSFYYAEKPVKENFEIILERGNIYLWRGANGSGKTTMANILLGFLQPNSGTLQINGQSSDWNLLKQFRNRFAFVNQESPLFIGTVKENILFGHPGEELAFEEIKNTWLEALMPPGVQSENRPVGERGEGLSGGELRRLTLIREWIRNSDLFILDEPLNHLDDFSIDEIKREIVNKKNESIIIIISHQKGFETIADKIVEF